MMRAKKQRPKDIIVEFLNRKPGATKEDIASEFKGVYDARTIGVCWASIYRKNRGKYKGVDVDSKLDTVAEVIKLSKKLGGISQLKGLVDTLVSLSR